jgi:hypothetical protein
MGVSAEIRELTERFERNKDAYRSPQYNEVSGPQIKRYREWAVERGGN